MNETVTTVIGKSQAEIIRSTVAKQDQNEWEKHRRGRNIVIKNIPESTVEQPLELIQSDKKWITAVCDITEEEIIRCYRVGKPKNGLPKLLVVTLPTPERAKDLHNFGNGKKVEFGGNIYCINPDLTAAERVANYKARQDRNKRRGIPAGIQHGEHGEMEELTAVGR